MHGIESWHDGRATFVAVKEHGWHRMNGVQGLSDTPLTIEEAMERANMSGLDYRIDPVYAKVGDEFIEIPNSNGLTRIHPFLRVRQGLSSGMSDKFTLHTPEQVTEFGQAIIDEGTPLAALGLIDDGRRMFAAFAMEGLKIGGEDAVNMFMNLMSGFDGRMVTVTRCSGIRVVCANTMNAVLAQTSMPTYTVRHIGEGLESRVQDARAALDIGWKSMEEFEKEANILYDREVTRAQFDRIVETFLPVADSAGQRERTKVLEQREQVRFVAEMGTASSIVGNAWGAWNALTEWGNWHAGRGSADSRLTGQIVPGSRVDKSRGLAMWAVREVIGV